MKFSEFLIISECDSIMLDLHNMEMEELIELILEGRKKIVPAHVKHPSINPKTGRVYRYDERITHLEFIKKALQSKGVHPKDIWVSFTDLEKLGINPNSDWIETPIGIYAYPIRYAVQMMRDNSDDLFASAKPWIQVLITKKNDKGKMINTSAINAGRDPLHLLNQYKNIIMQHLKKVWKITDEDIEEFFGETRDEVQWFQEVSKALESLHQALYKNLGLSNRLKKIEKVNWKELVDGFWDQLKTSEYLDVEENIGEKSIRFINKTFSEYWTHVKRLIKRGEQGKIPFEDVLKKFAEKHPEVDFEKTKEWVKANNFNSDIGVLYQVARKWAEKLNYNRSFITWSSILRKMGVSGISDLGTDTIYPSEPTQAVFLTPGSWEHVATVPNFENPTHKQVEGRPPLELARLVTQFRRQYKIDNEMYLWGNNLWNNFLRAEFKKRKKLPDDFNLEDSPSLRMEFNDWVGKLKDEEGGWDEDKGAHSIVPYGRSSGYKSRSNIRGTTQEMTRHSLEAALRKTLETIEAAVDSKRQDWEERAIRQVTHAIHLAYSWRKSTKEKPSLNNREILKRFYNQAMQDADMRVYMPEFLRRLKHLRDVMELDEITNKKSYGRAFIPNIHKAKKFFQINYPGEEKLRHVDKDVRFKPLTKISGFERVSWGGEALGDWIDFQQRLGIISPKDAADIRAHHHEFLNSENRFWEDGDLNTFSSSGDGSGAFRGQCGVYGAPDKIDKKDNMRRKFKNLHFSKKKSSKR